MTETAQNDTKARVEQSTSSNNQRGHATMFRPMDKTTFITNSLIFLTAVSVTTSLVLLIVKRPTPTTQPAPTQKPAVKQATFSIGTAPSKSLRGNITSFSGEALWQSRTATEASTLTENITLQQGETLKTDKKGTMIFQFPGITGTLAEKTELNIIQTLPDYIVFEQATGTVTYLKTNTSPLAVRAMHLLIEPSIGEIRITVDKDDRTITLQTVKGTATLGYNDSSSTTIKAPLSEGKKYVFDDGTRTGKVTKLNNPIIK